MGAARDAPQPNARACEMNKGRIAIALALTVHAISFFLMLHQVEPAYTNFYSLAWWTFIVFLAGMNHLHGRNSLLLDNPREFAWVFFYSILVWLFFEIYNFRLNNWFYLGVPAETYLRWPGYLIAYGTVLPGLFETETLLKNWRLFGHLRGPRITITDGLLIRFLVLGLLMMLAVLTSPRIFFPLVWVGLILILDPLVYWYEESRASFLGQIEQGDYSLLARLLVTGAICGLLWEFWNYWAGSKWFYNIPYLGFAKILEMPILGFLGFPPFVLECYLLYRASLLFRKRFIDNRKLAPTIVLILVIIYCILAFQGIDQLTIVSYKVRVD